MHPIDALRHLDEKLTSVKNDVTDLKVTGAKQSVTLEQMQADLELHIRRTDLLEAFVQRMNGVWLAVGGAAVVLGAIASIVKISELWR